MSQNAFDQKKEHILAEIHNNMQDLSPKGTIDELCWPIMNLVNSHPDMITTSSCSGRLSVFVEGNKLHNEEMKSGGKGDGGKWLFVTHKHEDVANWSQNLSEQVVYTTDLQERSLEASARYILYKYEPFILHVKCRDFSTASKLFSTAMACGFRESGIGSNNIVAVRVNIKLDVPIGYLDHSSQKLIFFVSKGYIEQIDGMTLSKFSENTKKMHELYDKIESQIIKPAQEVPVTKAPQETKEERRERKRMEGLLRQQQISREKDGIVVQTDAATQD
ncbi:LAME_0A05270g1_1 [Lachancea meyersii CBS 8951]|uniref:tRNA wybutosine-synthesizing protein 3 n=1 Tax=Lachancea meyersii CBS 8951 TaxID=1266667 RepID=A0A1G4IPS3_9SACH|nr:LAME_0A05270g1_1 [Lachancea meyersii CBS 8951]